ncbi:MAG: geranyl-CoA carboxylase alpha subunit [Hyphomicrobiales bacterium]|jgi:geranyl-CoA carboxylase alpha subunit|nr:geranyl-CoA carboxylase alpha subunit [Hyphomicrobiales bacterium]
MRSLLIANRGEIARRIMRTAKRMGLHTIAVYSDADREAPHVREADTAARIGGAAPAESYLNIAAIVDAAKRTGADSVHPGYGFLAENADFAQAVLDAGLVWVGPSPAVIRRMGDKAEAKRIARDAGVPTIPGAEPDEQSDAGLKDAAKAVGFPLMIKAVAGGGGRGMRLVKSESELGTALTAARSEAEHAFGNRRLLLERALTGARHIEVQVFADAHGNVIHLGERDCSVQRRHQKLIEEAPSPVVDADLREKLGAAAVALAKAVNYVGAGTIEFLLDANGAFYFMEMNTRLQVEHPVTEAITGTDLVGWQLRVAGGEPFTRQQSDIRFSGHAIEARLCAEDPARAFLPQAGRIALWRSAGDVRIDHALETGAEVSPYYDSMIAKVIARGATRDEARERLGRALDDTVVLGVRTNKAFLTDVLRDDEFARQGATTDFIGRRFAKIGATAPDAATLAIAAALRAASAGFGDWNSWSNNPERAMRVKFGDSDIALRFANGVYQAIVDASSVALRVRSIDPPHARVVLGDIEETVSFVIHGETIHLARAGQSFSLTDTTHAPAAKRAAPAGDGRLLAPMNGRVVAVNVKAGDSIEAGRALLVLEAMKMEHALSVPTASRVKAVHVAAGAQVSPGQLLAELEPA